MQKRNSHRQRAARTPLDLFLSHGAGVFFLFLMSQSAPYSDARAAASALHQLIEERVRAHLAQLLASVEMDAFNREALIQSKTQLATARVVARLSRCASRSQHDFARWLERQIADAIEDGDDQDPHGGSAALAPTSVVSNSWALHKLPIARAERDALVAAVLAMLLPAEREILLLMAHPRITWAHAAQSMRLTMFEAKQLYTRAQSRATAFAVQLAVRATGASSTGPEATAA